MNDELNELPPEENIFVLSTANASFIESHAAIMSPEELAQATRLPLEVVENYLEAMIHNSSTGVDPTKILNLIITVNRDGDINYGIKIPRVQNLHEYTDAIGRMLYLLHDGKLRSSMGHFLMKYGEERNAVPFINAVAESWLGLEKQNENRPLVSPNEVFRNDL